MMPDTIGLSYDIAYKPNPLAVEMQISTSGNQINGKIKKLGKIEDLTFTPNTDHGIADTIMSGVVWPLAEILQGVIIDKVTDMLEGMKFDNLHKVEEVSFGNIKGTEIKLTSKRLDIKGHTIHSDEDKMLLLTGEFDV